MTEVKPSSLDAFWFPFGAPTFGLSSLISTKNGARETPLKVGFKLNVLVGAELHFLNFFASAFCALIELEAELSSARPGSCEKQASFFGEQNNVRSGWQSHSEIFAQPFAVCAFGFEPVNVGSEGDKVFDCSFLVVHNFLSSYLSSEIRSGGVSFVLTMTILHFCFVVSNQFENFFQFSSKPLTPSGIRAHKKNRTCEDAVGELRGVEKGGTHQLVQPPKRTPMYMSRRRNLEIPSSRRMRAKSLSADSRVHALFTACQRRR